MTDCIDLAAPEPVFQEPWHAQAFALTVSLNESGAFTWADWVGRFSQTLKQHGLSKDLDGGDDYFAAWLETLEQVLEESGAANPAERDDTKAAWTRAYLSTPHGQPVKLPDQSSTSSISD
ncbi:MAG: nitrile hydratase accessory protein [Rhodobacteraceae bacterium]|nr:nitrile hydratase accessory protein [Paracoccaceae bacterium]